MWYQPGDVLAVRVHGIISHEGIVTEDGRLISNSRRLGSVQEESIRSFALDDLWLTGVWSHGNGVLLGLRGATRREEKIRMFLRRYLGSSIRFPPHGLMDHQS